jgi:hypothetical protein
MLVVSIREMFGFCVCAGERALCRLQAVCSSSWLQGKCNAGSCALQSRAALNYSIHCQPHADCHKHSSNRCMWSSARA